MARRWFSLTLFLTIFIYGVASAQVDGPEADLLYKRNSGHVTLDASDTNSERIISFVLATDQSNMRPDSLVENPPGNRGPFLDLGTNTDATLFQIGQADNQLGLGPVIDLGTILPTGIETVEALSRYLTLADYASELGAGGRFDLFVVLDAPYDCNGDGLTDITDANCLPDEQLDGFLERHGTKRGDADGKDGVQFADFLLLAGNFGDATKTLYTEGDFDRNGEVEFGDFLVLANNFGQGSDFKVDAGSTAVPEPSTITILLALLLLVGIRRGSWQRLR